MSKICLPLKAFDVRVCEGVHYNGVCPSRLYDTIIQFDSLTDGQLTDLETFLKSRGYMQREKGEEIRGP